MGMKKTAKALKYPIAAKSSEDKFLAKIGIAIIKTGKLIADEPIYKIESLPLENKILLNITRD